MGTFPIALIAQIKHGYLQEAIKKRGWTQKQAAEFFGTNGSWFGEVINLKKVPSEKWLVEHQEKLFELTGKLPKDLFPESLRTKEFLDAPKTIEATCEVPLHFLLSGRESLALPPTPEEILMNKDFAKGVREILSTLPRQQEEVIVKIFLEGKSETEVARELGKFRQSISQAKIRALNKLRHPMRVRKLQSLLIRK